jgi:hypothetical protein
MAVNGATMKTSVLDISTQRASLDLKSPVFFNK